MIGRFVNVGCYVLVAAQMMWAITAHSAELRRVASEVRGIVRDADVVSLASVRNSQGQMLPNDRFVVAMVDADGLPRVMHWRMGFSELELLGVAVANRELGLGAGAEIKIARIAENLVVTASSDFAVSPYGDFSRRPIELILWEILASGDIALRARIVENNSGQPAALAGQRDYAFVNADTFAFAYRNRDDNLVVTRWSIGNGRQLIKQQTLTYGAVGDIAMESGQGASETEVYPLAMRDYYGNLRVTGFINHNQGLDRIASRAAGEISSVSTSGLDLANNFYTLTRANDSSCRGEAKLIQWHVSGSNISRSNIDSPTVEPGRGSCQYDLMLLYRANTLASAGSHLVTTLIEDGDLYLSSWTAALQHTGSHVQTSGEIMEATMAPLATVFDDSRFVVINRERRSDSDNSTNLRISAWQISD